MAVQHRNLGTHRPHWGVTSFTDSSRALDDMERTFAQMEHEMKTAFRDFGMGPGRFELPRNHRFLAPRSSPSDKFFASPTIENGNGGENDGKYVVNMDIGTEFKPDDIKVTLKDRMLTIEGKIDHTSEDGHSRTHQEFSRSFSIPEGIKIQEVKSLFTPEGMLRIEAPLPEPSKPKEIPISVQSKSVHWYN